MEDSTIFTVGMVLFPFLLGPAIILALTLVGRAALRRRGQGNTSCNLTGPAVRWGCGLSALILVCAFCGLMVASAGGAIHPPLVTVAAPYVCDGTVETQSRSYSYKPGQQGIARNIFCLDLDGRQRDITLRTIGAAAVYYTLLFLSAALVLILLLPLVKSRRAADADPPIIAEFRGALADRLRIDADIVRRAAWAPDASRESVEGRLRHLQSLRDGGLISEEEYQVKRMEILASL
ncbi:MULTISPECIES: SHOCT domain-containing protein [Sphingopyxis]|uniref:SHOCT domain-containing protein n=1 Tax=Sphingopyxis panaciterrulae TaxID=462372 RepID=A0A7W9B9M6_9SPHN|nr:MULTISPECIES: SHOCT domain-containing protein [Sphingopyxis]MBB5708439.1 hypothetical protein [Sphingopyxis panaciterrulae]MCW0197643.1 SHOCT domain-containing protein [Sphingopyxis sp.]